MSGNGEPGMGGRDGEQADGDDSLTDITLWQERRHSNAPALSIWLLGGLRVATPTRTIDDSGWPLRKAKSLIKLLALTPKHRLHRLQVIDFLWPELEPDAALNNFHKILHIARRVLEPTLPPNGSSAYLHTRQGSVVLDPPGTLWIDVAAFWAAVKKARQARDPALYAEALRLSSQELLPEDRYEDWTITRREELNATRLKLLLELASLQEQRGDDQAAIEALYQVTVADPAHEEAQAHLMRLLTRTGRRHQAVRQYRQLREALRRELEVEPEGNTEMLYQQILKGELSPSGESVLAASSSLPLSPRDPPGKPPFVGRERELGWFRKRLERLAAGRGGLVLIRGQQGVGKSRLAIEVGKYAGREGAVVAWCSTRDDKNALPFDHFAVTLGGLPLRIGPAERLRVLGGGAGLDYLMPVKARDLGGGRAENGDQRRPFQAVVELFRSLASHATVVLLLEDLHEADHAALDLLQCLRQCNDDILMLLIGTMLSERGSPLQRLQVQQIEDWVEVLDLGVLQSHEAELLIRYALEGPVDDAVIKLVDELAHGNPYYTEEAVRALQGRGQIRYEGGRWRLRDEGADEWDVTRLRQRGGSSCSTSRVEPHFPHPLT